MLMTDLAPTRSYEATVKHVEALWYQNVYLTSDDNHVLLPTVVEASLRRELGDEAAERYKAEHTLPLDRVIDNANLVWEHFPNHVETRATKKLDWFVWHIKNHYPEHWPVFSKAFGYRRLVRNHHGRLFCTEPVEVTAARRKRVR